MAGRLFKKANVTPPERLWAEARGYLTTPGTPVQRHYVVMGAGFKGLYWAQAPSLADSDDKYSAAGKQLVRWIEAFQASRPSSDVNMIRWDLVAGLDLAEIQTGGIGHEVELTITRTTGEPLRLWNKWGSSSGCDELVEFSRNQIKS